MSKSEILTHLDESGNARMVDVGGKDESRRVAIAGATVHLSVETMRLLVEKALPKGDVLTTAKLAGVMAAKQTANLIPLCHPLALSFVDVNFEVDEEACTVGIIAEARLTGRTGVEMEALMAASVAALTIYDMCKAVQKDIVISETKLLKKTGGKSGEYIAK